VTENSFFLTTSGGPAASRFVCMCVCVCMYVCVCVYVCMYVCM
jgi:hypothetical protein